MNFLSLSLICHSCNLIKGQSVLIIRERESRVALPMLLTNGSGQERSNRLFLCHYEDVFSFEYRKKLAITKNVTEHARYKGDFYHVQSVLLSRKSPSEIRSDQRIQRLIMLSIKVSYRPSSLVRDIRVFTPFTGSKANDFFMVRCVETWPIHQAIEMF